MDPTSYKDFKTSRGLNYHYFLSPAQDARKPTLLFCHGFPSTSYDWYHQVDFFKKEGYGLVVPDLLGYGGSDKPVTPESYRMSLMVQDVVQILDHEKIAKVVLVGHDWGSSLASKFVFYHPERFIALAVFATGYMPPDPNFNYAALTALTTQAFGYSLVGYWEFFTSDDGPKIIEENIDSFYSLLFPADPKTWTTNFSPLGKARGWVSSNRIEGKVPNLTEEELKQHKAILLQGGFSAPVCWYKTMYEINPSEEKQLDLSPEKLTIQKPVFFGAALYDYVCLAEGSKVGVKKLCPNHKIVDFETDHWVMWAAPDKMNAELLEWLTNDVEGKSA